MLTRVKLWMAAAGLVLAALAASWLGGRNAGKTDAKVDALKGYVKTRKEMDDAEADMGHDPAVLRDWLRERGKQ